MASTINAKNTSSGLVLTPDASGQLELQTADTTRMTIDSSGNVGVGTNSPTAKITVSGSTGALNRAAQITPSSDATTIDSVRTFALQRSSNDTQLAIGYATTPDVWVISSSYGTTGAYKPIAFATSDTERMRIDSSGNLLINTTSVQGGLPVKIGVDNTGSSSGSFVFTNDAGGNQWTGWIWNKATTGNNLFIQFATEGTLTGRGSITYNRTSNVTAFNTTSDKRLKENIVPAPSAISKIESIKIRSFDWKETGNHVDFGVIAQELYEVAPESVTEGSDNADGSIKNYWGVDTSVLVPAMIKAIQELKVELDTVKAELAELKGAA